MARLIVKKKPFFLFGSILFSFLFLFKTPSLAQTPTVCPAKPAGLLYHSEANNWGITWTNSSTSDNTTGYVQKKSPGGTGKCISTFEAGSTGGEYWTFNSYNMFCGCPNVGFTAVNEQPFCPRQESDTYTITFPECSCARADFNRDNEVDAADSAIFTTCFGCTPWSCNWSYCGRADTDKNNSIDMSDLRTLSTCFFSKFCWCGTRPPDDTLSYVCEGRYFGQPQCKTKAVSHPQGACVLEPKWGWIDRTNPLSSTNHWKWTYCYPEGQTPVSVITTPNLTPTTSSQKVCEGKYFGEPQCRAKVTPKAGYSCQLNPALGQINPVNPTDSINYWKWSYCKN